MLSKSDQVNLVKPVENLFYWLQETLNITSTKKTEKDQRINFNLSTIDNLTNGNFCQQLKLDQQKRKRKTQI